jgi:hypothetical protein
MRMVDLYLETSPVGSGRRFFFVTEEGRKYARLFYPATCTAFQVPLETLREARDVSPSRGMAALIRANLKQRKAWGYRVNEAVAKEVLSELKAR